MTKQSDKTLIEDKPPRDEDTNENEIIDIEEQIIQSGAIQQGIVTGQNKDKTNAQEEIARLLNELRQKNEEIDKLKSYHLRALADYENLSKRTKAERQIFLKSANADLLTKFLDLADSFEKGAESISRDSLTPVTVKDGFKAIESQFFTILKNEGIERIACRGEKFDPSLHEVILVRSDPNVQEDTILEEVQAGYKLNSVLLRPSKVIIAKK